MEKIESTGGFEEVPWKRSRFIARTLIIVGKCLTIAAFVYGRSTLAPDSEIRRLDFIRAAAGTQNQQASGEFFATHFTGLPGYGQGEDSSDHVPDINPDGVMRKEDKWEKEKKNKLLQN